MCYTANIHIHLIISKNSILHSPSELSWRCRTANITVMFTSVTDLSKFKGGRLSFRRCYAKSYEVCAFLFFPLQILLAHISRLRVAKSRTQVTSATNNRISPSLLRVTSLQFRSRLLPRTRIIVAVNCARTWVGDNHLEVG